MYYLKKGFSAIELVLTILVILVAIVFILAFKPVTVSGPAMGNNYPNGANYLAFKLSYLISQPKRGDVVIFKYTNFPDFSGINRIIGLPGDKMKIQTGKVYINEQPLSEPYLSQNVVTETETKRELQTVDQTKGTLVEVTGVKLFEEGQEFTILENNYFMMGDDRQNSIDSRSLGFVERKDIIGTIVFRYK